MIARALDQNLAGELKFQGLIKILKNKLKFKGLIKKFLKNKLNFKE